VSRLLTFKSGWCRSHASLSQVLASIVVVNHTKTDWKMGFGLEHGHLMHQRICKQCGTRRLVSGAVQQLSDAHDVFDLAVLRRPAGGLLSAVCKLVQGAADVEVQTPRSASSSRLPTVRRLQTGAGCIGC
jgi:hypothetical protein